MCGGQTRRPEVALSDQKMAGADRLARARHVFGALGIELRVPLWLPSLRLSKNLGERHI